MSWRLSISRKLMLVVMAVSTMTMLLSAVGVATYEIVSFRKALVSEVCTLADVIGANSSASLAFRDKKTAMETLSALSAVPHIVSAILYNANGDLLVECVVNSDKKSLLGAAGRFDGARVMAGNLVVFRPIVLSGERVGEVGIQADMDGLYLRLRRYGAMTGLIFLCAGVLALLLSVRLHHVISDPILELSRTAHAVSIDKDYSVRAIKHGEDELGELTDVFNNMLSEIQRRDEALRLAHEDLEERVRQRTAELQQEVLIRRSIEVRQSQLLRDLEAANRELNDFAYIVSHDLKAPLRAIGSLAEWLATDYSDKIDEEGQKKLGLLLNRAKRMHDLINAILEYSRIGRTKDEVVDVDLVDVVRDVIDLLSPPSNVEVRLEGPIPVVRFDRTRLVQLMQNLIGNAVKYMDKPKGLVVVSSEDAGAFWRITVKDNGPGIDAKYYDRIFQIFQTLSPRDKVESTGVGLAIVKKIVSTAGGDVWVESTLGAGSSFVFTVPKAGDNMPSSFRQTLLAVGGEGKVV